MKFLKQILAALVIILAIVACNNDDDNSPSPSNVIYEDYLGEIYQINFYDLKKNNNYTEMESFIQSIEPIVQLQGGSILTDPVKIIDNLIENPGLPATARSFDYDFMVLFKFPNQEAYQATANDPTYIELRVNFENIFSDKVVESVNQLAPAPSGQTAPPVFGSMPSRPSPPAFYLLNLSKFVETPEAQQSFNEYLQLQIPRVISVETRFTNQFVNIRVIRGEFLPTDLISLTEWRDQDAFDFIHNDVDAVENIFPLRNNAIQDLVEAKVIIGDEEKIMHN